MPEERSICPDQALSKTWYNLENVQCHISDAVQFLDLSHNICYGSKYNLPDAVLALLSSQTCLQHMLWYNLRDAISAILSLQTCPSTYVVL